MSQATLTATDIKKCFGGEEALRGISLEVHQGEVLAVIGPFGSGKSTPSHCIAQLENVDSGVISVRDDVLVRNSPNRKAVYSSPELCQKIGLHLGLVFQNFNLFPHYSVLKDVTDASVHMLQKSHEEATAIAGELLKKMGFSEKADAYSYQFSDERQQRVLIARVLAMNPEILFFDELTSVLDLEPMGEVLQVMRQLAVEHTIMVVVMREMQFAHDVADHVISMDGGTVLESNMSDEIFLHTRSKCIRAFFSRFTERALRQSGP